MLPPVLAPPCFTAGSQAQPEVVSVTKGPNHLSFYLMFSGIPNG